MAKVTNEPIDDFSDWQLAAYRPKESPESAHQLNVIRPLGADEVQRFEKARSSIFAFLLSEPYSLVVSNFTDYAAYRESMDEMVVALPQSEWPNPFSMGQELRRRFFNWLLAVRIFLTHTEIRFKHLYGEDSPEFEQVKNAMREAFDSDFSYRFIDKLRNYAEHSGFPALEGRIEGELVGDVKQRRTHLWFDRDELLARFKKWGRVKEELQSQAPHFAAEEHMTRMMEHLARIHEVGQSIERDDIRDGLKIVEGFIAEAAPLGGIPQLVKLRGEEGMDIRPFPLVTREMLGISDP